MVVKVILICDSGRIRHSTDFQFTRVEILVVTIVEFVLVVLLPSTVRVAALVHVLVKNLIAIIILNATDPACGMFQLFVDPFIDPKSKERIVDIMVYQK